MKTLLLLLAIASIGSVSLRAAPQSGATPVGFIYVDNAPRPPAFTKAGFFQYLRWFRVY